MTTITKALYQPSEKGMSLLFTCPQLTEESSLAAAARTRLHSLCNFYQIESIPQFLELWSTSMQINGTLSFTLLYRNATTYGISCYIIVPIQYLKTYRYPSLHSKMTKSLIKYARPAILETLFISTVYYRYLHQWVIIQCCYIMEKILTTIFAKTVIINL